MFLKLRILFTVLAAICLAVVIPAGAMFGGVWFFIFGGGALMFFLAMLICKQKQNEADPLSKEVDDADFLHPELNDNEKK